MSLRAWQAPAINRRLVILAAVLLALAAGASGRSIFGGGTADTPVAPPVQQTTSQQVAALEAQVASQPGDVDALTQLASAYLGRARETSDPSFYTLAGTAVQRALAADPNNVEALVVSGSLALSRHDFNEALLLGERARQIEPTFVATYGVITDAYVETGHYPQAIAAAQQMADLHPDFASYSRISYIRELNGDLDGAIQAMQQAVDSGSGIKQDAVWGLELLGNMYEMKGDIAGAERQFQQASLTLPEDAASEEGMSRVAALKGDHAKAEALLQSAISQRPLLQYVIELGDLYATDGRTADAQRQYDLVAAIQKLYAANGGDGDMESSLFNADHNINPEQTYQTALGAYTRRSSVYAADAVAWSALKAGHMDAAQTYIVLARRLGTRDPKFAYHAGMIELFSGDRPAAMRDLRDALSRSSTLSPLDVRAIRNTLADLG